jgi:hypothetical protein
MVDDTVVEKPYAQLLEEAGLTENNRRNHDDDACCTGLSPEWAL